MVSGTVRSVDTVQNGGSNTDVFVAELTSRIDTSDVPIVPFPSDTAIAAFGVGSDLLPYGFTASMGRNTVSGIDVGQSAGTLGGGGALSNTPTFEFTYSSTTGLNSDARLEVGGSGSPTFFDENGTLALVGTHSALIAPKLGSYQSIDADLTRLIDEINSTIGSMGSTGFEVTQVPEPAHGGTILACLCGLFVFRHRPRRSTLDR